MKSLLLFVVVVSVAIGLLGQQEWSRLESGVTRNRAIVTPKEGEIELVDLPIPKPSAGQVLIRVNYAPINPSDVYMALGTYFQEHIGGYPHLNGFEGMGEVVGSGGGLLGALLTLAGARVGFVASKGGGAWSEYVAVDAMEVLPLALASGYVSDQVGAAAFVNPMTVVGMLEVAREGGHRALVHTAASSALGKMLLRAAKRPQHNVTVVAVVRGDKNARELVMELGHPTALIVRSDAADYEQRLRDVIERTGASLLFDAVAGPQVATLLQAMPARSENYVYGMLSGQPAPAELYQASTPQKSLAFFHVKEWIDQGGLPRLLKVASSLLGSLSTDLATRFQHERDFHDPNTLEIIRSYFQHQAGGKNILKIRAD